MNLTVETATTFGTVTRHDDGRTFVSATGEQLRDWARRGDCSWPCSVLARLLAITATFDAVGDLVELQGDEGEDVPADELGAWASECLERAGYPNHPAIRPVPELKEPCVCGGTGDHEGQSVDSCDECARHWHVATGLAGYGPDGEDGYATFETLGAALDYAREELSTFVDMSHEDAHDLALHASQYHAAWKLDGRPEMLQMAVEHYADAWRELERADALALLQGNLDPARANAPLYRDNAAAYAALQAEQASAFPHDVSHNARLYLWECDTADCEHWAEVGASRSTT